MCVFSLTPYYSLQAGYFRKALSRLRLPEGRAWKLRWLQVKERRQQQKEGIVMKSPNFKRWASRRLLKLYLHNREPKHWLGDAVRAYRIRKRFRKRTARLRAFRRNAMVGAAGAASLTYGWLNRRAGKV